MLRAGGGADGSGGFSLEAHFGGGSGDGAFIGEIFSVLDCGC